jgi:hypothetical protein
MSSEPVWSSRGLAVDGCGEVVVFEENRAEPATGY